MSSRIIFDASTLISLSEKCFFHLLERIQSHSNARFLISESVWKETVETPQRIKRFELNAERVKEAVETGWLEIVQPTRESGKLAEQIADWSNHAFFIEKKPFAILQAGEIESMALYVSLKAQALAIDERTCRMLIEEPARLQNYIGMKQDKKVKRNDENIQSIQELFRKAVIVRSVDLLAWAYRHGLFKFELDQNIHALEAALYAVKFSGCSVSGEEIEQYVTKTGKKGRNE
jgi:predicted nucleic acid-binding protein